MQTIKQWVFDNFDASDIQAVSEHGCVSGAAPGLIYYHETTAFHDAHESEIWDMLHDDLNDMGLSVMELITEFNGSKHVDSMAQFKNLLAWYAVERICNDIVNESETEEG